MPNEILKTNLDPACILLDLQANTPAEAIRELVGSIHAKHRLRDLEGVIGVVLAREQKMSTSLENGVAVPHGKTDIVDRLVVAMGIKQKGIDFRSSDGQRSNIIILMVSPASQGGPHVRCLAEIGRLLQSEANRKKLLAATDKQTVYKIMAGL